MSEAGEQAGVENLGPPTLFDYDKFDLPANVSLEIMLGAHSSSKDLPEMDELRAKFLESDIVIIEAEGADYEIELQALNSLSQGDPETYRQVREQWIPAFNNPGWKEVFYGALYGCDTPVTIIDLPFGHPLTARRQQLVRQSEQVAVQSNFDYAVTSYQDLFERELKVLKKRDQRILQNMAPAIDTVVASNEELQAKRTQQPLRVFMVYGGDHVSLFDALSHKAELTDDNTFSVTADRRFEVKNPKTDVYSKFLRGESVSRDDAARLVLISFLSIAYDQLGLIDHSNMSTRDIFSLIQESVDGLSYDELNQLRSDVTKQINNS